MKNTKTVNNSYKKDFGELLQEIVTKEGTISQCYRLFHNYSVCNQWLAYIQMASRGIELSPINSYGGWQKLNRQVRRGEKAIYLWQPLIIKVDDVDKNGKPCKTEKLIFKFKPLWFALSQTDGDNTVDIDDVKIDGFNFTPVYKKYDIELIPFEEINGNVQGYAITKDKKLAINPLAQHAEMTILHEVAHIALKHHEMTDMDRGMKEMEAETVAYIVGNILGLPDEQLSSSRAYVQGWFKNDKIADKNAKRILKVANEIIKEGLENKD